MGVDVGGGGKVAVTHPLLNGLHGHAVGHEKRCAAVPQIVKANAAKPRLLEKPREGGGDVVGL